MSSHTSSNHTSRNRHSIPDLLSRTLIPSDPSYESLRPRSKDNSMLVRPAAQHPPHRLPYLQGILYWVGSPACSHTHLCAIPCFWCCRSPSTQYSSQGWATTVEICGLRNQSKCHFPVLDHNVTDETLLATAFPFAFAIVVGNALKRISALKLKRGTTVGFLEQMTGSLSVGSTVATQLLLRPINLLALLLLGLWSFSPLGSQSCLQVLSVSAVPQTTGANVTISYFDLNAEAALSTNNGASTTWNGLFAAAIVTPAVIRNSSVDLWGHVKVPNLARPGRHSSLLGIPISGIPKQANITFQLETSYMAVSCDNNLTYFPLPVNNSQFTPVSGFGDDYPIDIALANDTFFST